MITVRPSALPKLAVCRCFESKPATSPEAARGTKLDAIIRAAWNGEPIDADLPAEDEEAVAWALETLRALHIGGSKSEVFTAEEQLRAVVPVQGVEAGTMDACCPSQAWLADFKTGQERNYMEQMAAYALACMEAYWAEEWTAHLLFIDQKKVTTHHFTRQEAADIVRSVVNAPIVATCCEYCGWCAAQESCPAIQQAAAEVTAPDLPACTPSAVSRGELPSMLEALAASEEHAHAFLSKLKVVNDWADLLKNRIKNRLELENSDYFSRVVTAGRRVVSPADLATLMPAEQVLPLCTAINLKKAEEALTSYNPAAELPESMIKLWAPSVSLRLKTVKKNLPKSE